MLYGRYSDGVSPLLQDAEVERTDLGLFIRAPRLPERMLWLFEEIYVERHGIETRLMHIRQDIDTGARLTLNSIAFDQAFSADRKRFRSRRPGETGGVRIAIWATMAIAAFALLIFFGLPAFARFAAPFVPYSWEVALGESVEKDVLEMVTKDGKARFCTAPGTPSRAALDEMVRRLTENTTLQGPLKVDIVDVSMTNAFALPGGRIILFRDVVEKASNADEVAAVLAHEIGHVVHRHSMRALMHDGALSIVVGMMLGDITGGSTITVLSRMMLGSAYSREQERDADQVSVKLMHDAGADPRALNIFFRRLLKEDQGGIAVFRSHPLTAERIESVDRLADATPGGRRGILSPASWKALQGACHTT